MENLQLLKNLQIPQGTVDAVIDTDTYNEVDDQFALAYMLKSNENINVKAIYAAPFHNSKSDSPCDGMYKSYNEIMKLLEVMGKEEYKKCTFHGSEHYMENEETPVESDAMKDLISRARQYTSENPLYVVCIGAITNVASAIAAAPDISENIVIVWLGGHDIHVPKGCGEFNMMQDIAAARVVFTCNAPLVQLPCRRVVSSFAISEPEFNFWLKGKNELCDFLVDRVAEHMSDAKGTPWTKVIWDVTAVAWLMNDNNKFMDSVLMPAYIPEYDMRYAYAPDAKIISYVTGINKDSLFADMIDKLTR